MGQWEQLSFNVFLSKFYLLFVIGSVCALYFLFFATALISDSYGQWKEEIVKQELKVENCRSEYYRNRCEPHERVEALREYCSDRELCMKTPSWASVKILHSPVKVLSGGIQAFVEVLDYKSLAFLLLPILILVYSIL